MDLVRAYEVTSNNEVPTPQSLHTMASEKSELNRKDNFETEEITEWDVKCITAKTLETRCGNDNKEFPWLQDLKGINCNYAILVEVLKAYEKKKSTEYCGQPITASVKINHESKMVLVFSKPINAQISAFRRIIKDVLKNAKPCTPENLDNNFEFAYLYFNCEKSPKITSFKVSLEQFCSHIHTNFQITSDIVMKPSNAMDVPVTREINEQAEEINPIECAAKDSKYLMYQKQSYNHSNSNSTEYKDINHSRNNRMPNAEVQDKAVDSGLYNNDEIHSDSKENYQRNSKTHQNQVCVSHLNVNESGNCGNGYGLKKREMVDGSVQSSINSPLRDEHTSHDRREKPLSTGCDLHYQDRSASVLQVESAQVSSTCSVSVNEKSSSTEHSIEEHQSRHIKFCCLSEIACDEDCSGLRRKYFGVKSSLKEEKVIILIGNQGSGKTALVNFAANFLKGVEDADDKLYYVMMDKLNGVCHTSSVTAYTFCFAEDAAPITIIDTPGLRDGRETDKNNPLQTLKTFFINSDSNIQLHAIGYVISSSAVGLTSSEHHMIDFLIEHYGHGISTNFITIVTFVADVMKNNPHNDMFTKYGIKSKVLLKFNNTAFSKKELDDFDRAYWKMGIKNLKKCINHLKKLPPLTMKTLKLKQKEIYSTCMVKSLEEKLKGELKSFMLAYKDTHSLMPSIQVKSEQIWRSAIVLYRLLSTSDCSLSVESVLVKYVDEVAREISFPSKDCVMLLSLCPSRGLLEAGKRVIEFIGPIHTQIVIDGKQKRPMGKEPEVLFCKKCDDQHEIKRVESKSKKSDVTYHCTKCQCDESEHSKWTKAEYCEKKCYIPIKICLEHTKKALENVLQEFSVPGHKLNIISFLKIVRQNVDEQFNYFIDSIIPSCT
ncbi:uncharacterized protein LOC123498237 isoform X1 [Portunus trituberculatus]|uniref:uncharacterized protein LOC123498237 isoform X1 n=1 Tax=Portunus trituberculatus TaxID=210409 RepID=UPI001E1CF01B|nr:uncharacterized protein LOC123498237 isoform X1 [Portunus trituberculatus]XP_045101336.1 uncharacterized protein LOC123498237 isoform X1 [Portunus trituberculatus]XP_045101337.1 uncharacterized protein LOC123498237 isoform X1 [Portunus trituberculatus]